MTDSYRMGMVRARIRLETLQRLVRSLFLELEHSMILTRSSGGSVSSIVDCFVTWLVGWFKLMGSRLAGRDDYELEYSKLSCTR